MTNKRKWILGGVAALLVSGALFAVPALAEEQGVSFRGFGSMSAMHAAMSGKMMGMGGNMAAMHNSMAPLMSQMEPMHQQVMGEVAALLNMSLDELNAAMAEGKSLAQLAEEQNVAPGEIQSLMTRNMKGFLDQAVEDGTLTREQANQMFQMHQQHGANCVSGQYGDMHSMMFGSN